jgi:hypothetical protein
VGRPLLDSGYASSSGFIGNDCKSTQQPTSEYWKHIRGSFARQRESAQQIGRLTSTELSVETDYRNISRTHTTNSRARCSLCDPTVEYIRELSDSSVQLRRSSVGSWDQTQAESVSIEDSRGQQSSEKRDGLVGSHRLEGRYTSSKCYKCRVV